MPLALSSSVSPDSSISCCCLLSQRRLTRLGCGWLRQRFYLLPTYSSRVSGKNLGKSNGSAETIKFISRILDQVQGFCGKVPILRGGGDFGCKFLTSGPLEYSLFPAWVFWGCGWDLQIAKPSSWQGFWWYGQSISDLVRVQTGAHLVVSAGYK